MNTNDQAMLQSIMDLAYEQAVQQQFQELKEQLHDLDGRYGCLNRQYTRLVRVSQSQAGLLERIEAIAREAHDTTSEHRRLLLILDIVVMAGNGAAALKGAMDAPIAIRKE